MLSMSSASMRAAQSVFRRVRVRDVGRAASFLHAQPIILSRNFFSSQAAYDDDGDDKGITPGDPKRKTVTKRDEHVEETKRRRLSDVRVPALTRHPLSMSSIGLGFLTSALTGTDSGSFASQTLPPLGRTSH